MPPRRWRDLDESVTRQLGVGSAADHVSMVLNVVHVFASPGNLVLSCASDHATGDVRARHIRITAVKANTLTNSPLA